MISKTNTGEMVDLSRPENIRRGMVFRSLDCEYVALTDGREVGLREMRYEAPNTVQTVGLFVEHMRFMGCHPAFAARAECERFGIAESFGRTHGGPVKIDAGAHGFARTRDGFAVDLRRERFLPPGSVILGRDGQRAPYHYAPTPLFENEQWCGLNARHARPEDVARLCCGERSPTWRHTGHPSSGDYDVTRQRCTLAIGGHAEHEDLATGVRWAAAPSAEDINAFEAPATFAGMPFPEPSAMLRTLRIGDLMLNCLVTELSSRDRHMGREMIAGPRRVSAKIVTKDAASVTVKLAEGLDVELRERGKTTRMFVVSWSRQGRPAERDAEELAIELAADTDLSDGSLSLHRAAPRCCGCGGAANQGLDAVCIAAPNERGETVRGDFCADCAKKDWGGARFVGGRLVLPQCHRCRAPSDKSKGGWCSDDCRAQDQLAARDVAVAKAIADVPAGCDPGGWANVVRVLAADNWDGPYPRAMARNRAGFPQYLAEEVADARESIAGYARARFVFRYSPAAALRWVLEAEAASAGLRPENVEVGAVKLAERLFAAYEAGR